MSGTERDGLENEVCNEVLPVRVIVRTRPFSQSELIESSRSCISFSSGGQALVIGKDRAFTFDAVYTPSSSQESIFQDPLVESCFCGYNATVLAYGQTGAGKTYTMGTGNNVGKSENELGMVPRVMKEIYAKIESFNTSIATISIKASYIEIYNDEIKDLLFPSAQGKSISIRERADGTIVLAGVKEIEVNNLQHMQQLLEDGSLSRTVAGTLMNTNSSRSHSIFSIAIEQKRCTDSISAKFHLVDLAGSERAKRTGNVGLRLKESVNINAGLLALGNVISALGDERKKNSHVPYRESKLTRMLQDSLGGNSRTLMIACVSPADPSFEETLNTLKYANRARNIKNKPIVNRNSEEASSLKQDFGQDESLKIKDDMVDEMSLRIRIDDLESQVEDLTNRLSKAEASNKWLGEQNILIMADKEQSMLQAEEARSQLAELANRFRVLGETSSVRQSIRASLKTVERQFLAYGAAQVEQQLRRREFSNSETMTVTKNEAAENGKLLELQMKAEQAHQELEAKTRELEQLEAALMKTNCNENTLSVDSLKRAVDDHRENADVPNIESRVMIERNNRIIQRLEGQLQECRASNAKLAEQVSELREDLARDEEIFSQKQDEIQRLSSQVEELLLQLGASRSRIEELTKSHNDTSTQDLRQSALESDCAGRCDDIKSVFLSNQTTDTIRSVSMCRDDSLSVTMQQQANIRLASLLDEDDSVRVGDDLLDAVPARGPAVQSGAQDGLHLLERGFAALETEKERLALEKQALEEETHSLTRRFHMDQHHAEKRVKALEFNIQLKQDLIRNLVRNEQDLQAVNEEHRQRIRDLEREIDVIRSERDRTTSASGSATCRSKPEDMTPENRRVRDQYTAKLRAREQELESLRRQHEESLRMMKVQEQKEKRIRSLESEVGKMRQQCEQVKIRAKDEAERFERMRATHASKMRELKARMESRVKELESENERQREALQRKTDELHDAHSALRARGDRPPSRSDGAGESPSTRRDWLDREIGEVLRRKRAVDQLERELKQRETIVATKEAAARRRAGLQLKKGRKEEEVRQSVRGLEDQISLINAQIRSRQEASLAATEKVSAHPSSTARPVRSAGSDREEASLEVLRCETAALQRQREDAMAARAALEETLRTGAYLGDEEECLLVELEERLEGLDAAIENKGQAILELQEEVSREGQRTAAELPPLEAILAGAPLESVGGAEAREMLRDCVRRVVALSEREREREAEAAAAREREDELEDQVQSLRAAELEWDRRMTELQREHEGRVRALVDQLRQRAGGSGGGRAAAGSDGGGGASGEVARALEEQVSTLERDNFYYKQSCTNLKRRLRDLTAEADRDREAAARAAARVATLEAQLTNVKAFVGATAGAAQVFEHCRPS